MFLGFIKRLLYRAYEARLAREIKSGRMPCHIGVILDGNRRFASMLSQDHAWGHERGYEKVEELLDWCLELGIRELTLYAFSTENFNRAPEEVGALMNLLEKACRKIITDPKTHRNRVKFRAIGRLSMLPDNLRATVDEAEKATASYDNFHLNIALSYGGRAEIIDAIKAIYEKVGRGEIDAASISEETVSQHLYKEDMPDPEMIIRTSGEMRLSGFLLWQSAYSELYFTDVYFPAFRRVDFLRALRNYQARERRFGK